MRPILFFDSGIGGLTVLRKARQTMPERQFIYVADDAGFPYGTWEEDALKAHIIELFKKLLARYNPELCVVACNTASTLVLNDLRTTFPDYAFVGTVPAIKPATEQTRSKLISVLATPGTVRRAYTRDLVASFAGNCKTNLVGSEKLAGFAENYLRGLPLDMEAVRHEIAPCFVEEDGRHTDIVVLACTHYPFLTNVFRKLAPWPVDWLDPSEAIAKRAKSLLKDSEWNGDDELKSDLAYFTSGEIDFAAKRLLYGFGLKVDRNA